MRIRKAGLLEQSRDYNLCSILTLRSVMSQTERLPDSILIRIKLPIQMSSANPREVKHSLTFYSIMHFVTIDLPKIKVLMKVRMFGMMWVHWSQYFLYHLLMDIIAEGWEQSNWSPSLPNSLRTRISFLNQKQILRLTIWFPSISVIPADYSQSVASRHRFLLSEEFQCWAPNLLRLGAK
jgi:hypothetical protein